MPVVTPTALTLVAPAAVVPAPATSVTVTPARLASFDAPLVTGRNPAATIAEGLRGSSEPEYPAPRPASLLGQPDGGSTARASEHADTTRSDVSSMVAASGARGVSVADDDGGVHGIADAMAYAPVAPAATARPPQPLPSRPVAGGAATVAASGRVLEGVPSAVAAPPSWRAQLAVVAARSESTRFSLNGLVRGPDTLEPAGAEVGNVVTGGRPPGQVSSLARAGGAALATHFDTRRRST